MPNAKGAVLTDRDRALLTYVGIARYASADHVHRLIAPGHSKKLVYRRLAKLCLPGGRIGQGACLRRLQYRRAEGTGVPVWALTPYGRSLVAPLVPWLPPPAAHDVGHRFLEHTLLLNDVLLWLVLALRRSEMAPLAELPFRWLAEGDEALQFRALGRHLGESFQAVLKPDAILEIPGSRRRVFVEAETGTQSIVTSHPERTGAVIAKLQRYQEFFTVRSDDLDATWYRRAFRDDLAPRLLFLVHSPERRQRVEKAVKAALPTHALSFKVLVFTFDEAAGKLLSYFEDFLARRRRAAPPPPPTATPPAPSKSPPASAPPPPPAPPRFALAVNEPELRRLRDSFQRVYEALQDAYDAIDRHQRAGRCRFDIDGFPVNELELLRSLILKDRPGAPGPAPARPGGA